MYIYSVNIDNIRPYGLETISATCHHPRFAPPVMASGFAVNDYRSVLRDLWDAEELKIKSVYSSSLKATVERLCSERCEVFEKHFQAVKEGVARIRANSDASEEQPHFRSMFLYLAQELPDILKKMPNHYSDPILWQVSWCS